MRLIRGTISSLMIIFMVTSTAYSQSFSESNCLLNPNEDSSNIVKAQKTDKSNLYRGQQDFTMSLLRAVNMATPNENVFFSPYSTYHALLLAYFGSANNTERELIKALHLDWAATKQNVKFAYTSQKKSRNYKENDVEFASADKIYVGLDTPLRDCIKDIFTDEIENVNFQEKPEECRKQINKWVSDLTKNEIPEFLSQGDVSSQTNMILANAAYFKGEWESKFDTKNTKMEVFYTGPEKRSFVDMMNHKGMYYMSISEQLKCHILDIPYKGNDQISMMILLPPLVNNGSSLQEVLDRLTPESLKSATDDFELREIKVGLPKFTFEQRLQLVPILNEIGINDLFTGRANLKTFSDSTNLALGDALHVAKIKVDEEGSTAAAATALFSFRSARPLEPTEFICNHPFLFLIYDHKLKAILFAGIYRSP
ncbi:serine protease inhibitor 88Ea-like [Condylostylus longicornis]|uniref:serine protease inhibitor 88Ea-like n=1 Tax=Condylostylus longicornis TaxID=2530218 RepID=UPI00244E0A43|nr:serine protease inhibitor 88Ea-like [Condylostylus longicornis]